MTRELKYDFRTEDPCSRPLQYPTPAPPKLPVRIAVEVVFVTRAIGKHSFSRLVPKIGVH